MSSEGIDYQGRVHRALLALVREVLREVAAEGLPDAHHFYLTFRTDEPGCELPAAVRSAYPEQMTIVLQHQFWDLEVDDDGFAVTLRFAGRPQRLRVPFEALESFVDPEAQFGLKLKLTPAEPSPAEPSSAEAAGEASKVVAFPGVRKREED